MVVKSTVVVNIGVDMQVRNERLYPILSDNIFPLQCSIAHDPIFLFS